MTTKDSSVLTDLLAKNAKVDGSVNAENGLVDDTTVATVAVVDLPKDRLVSPLAGQSHFTDSQKKGEKHSHVSKIWTDNCISWDTLHDKLEQSSQYNHDITVDPEALTLHETTETVIAKDEEGQELEREYRKLVLNVDHSKYGGQYDFSGTSLAQFGGIGFTELGNRFLGVGRDDYEIDRIYDVYKHRFANAMSNRSKKVFLRLRNDGDSVRSVRAMLSDRYAVIDHRWVAKTMENIVSKDALISHFEEDKFVAGGGDVVRYNVLLPDSIRKESDSDYGGMISSTNNEVGGGRNKMLPSVFKAICMNGCIWGQSKDNRFAIDKVHRGSIDLDYEALKIARSINAAIPLLDGGIDMLLNSKELKAEADIMRLTYQIAKSEFSLTAQERKDLLGTIDEAVEAEGLDNSAFGCVNVFTRYAGRENVSLNDRQEIEETIGRLLGKWTDKPQTFDLVSQNAMSLDMKKLLG